MATIEIKDASGNIQTVGKYLPGQAAASDSAPVVLSAEDKAALDNISSKLGTAPISRGAGATDAQTSRVALSTEDKALLTTVSDRIGATPATRGAGATDSQTTRVVLTNEDKALLTEVSNRIGATPATRGAGSTDAQTTRVVLSTEDKALLTEVSTRIGATPASRGAGATDAQTSRVVLSDEDKALITAVSTGVGAAPATRGAGAVDAQTSRVTLSTEDKALLTEVSNRIGTTPASRGAGATDVQTTRVVLSTEDKALLTEVSDRIGTTPASRGAGATDAQTSRVVFSDEDKASIEQLHTDLIAPIPAGTNHIGKVNSTNFISLFRDSFDDFTPGDKWTVANGTGDFITLEGNTAGTSYLVISKSPLHANTTTSITSLLASDMPIEIGVGLHTSQRTLGQEFSVEMVSDEAPIPDYVDVAISSISQATTTLTVDTATAHGLNIGAAISIYGVNDSRLNYPSLVVATIPTPTRFTVTAGPGGNIPSVTAGPFTQGFVTKRPRLGYATSGTSMIFENATVTNASMYVRSNSGESQMTGTIAGSHAVTVGTTASVQAVNAPFTYAFRPTTEYRLSMLSDRVQWYDSAVDSTVQATARQTWTQVAPDLTKKYRIRVRAVNNRGLTIPVAKIISMAKTGTTTATVVTDVAHGLTTADQVVIYGSSNQTTFANLVTATAISSIVNTTTFTIVIGTAVTATVYGGYVARVNGGNLSSSLGAIAQTATSATLANAADGTRILTLTGNAAWAGLLIGDFVNVLGLRSVPGAGADLGCDGAWKVRNVSGTALELGPAGGLVPPANFGATACGGAVIKRTDLRLSFIRMFEYDRTRVEVLTRPASDTSSAVPTVIQNIPAVTVNSGTVTTVSTVTAVTTVSTVNTVSSVTAANFAIPGIIVDTGSAVITSTATSAAVTPTFGLEYEVNQIVTAVSGTTPTMDLVIQESDDSGTNWFDVYHFPRITAIGAYRSPKLPLKGNRIRYVETIGGTTPSFTRSRNRLQGSSSAVTPIRQLFDRTAINLTSLNSTTPSLDVQDCRNVQLAINIGTATTPPALQLEGSEDNGASWFSLGSPLSAVASSTVQLTVNLVNVQLIRARVSTAGSTVVVGYVKLKGF